MREPFLPNLDLPILSELVPSGFPYGITLLVEFEPSSLWYETSLTIAARALANGIRTDYHTLQHIPNEVRQSLRRLGVNTERLEGQEVFRILDTYTSTTGLAPAEKTSRSYDLQSVKMSDWSIAFSKLHKGGIPESEKRRLHIDDNTSVYNQYNQEKEILDVVRTRAIAHARDCELVMVWSIVSGVWSDGYYRQMESLADAIFDFRVVEKVNEPIEHLVRCRMIRGQTHDSRLRRLRLQPNGEVKLSD